MQLEDEDIREFIQIWEEEFHETLAPDAARHHASQLLELYALIAKLPALGKHENTSHEPSTPS